MWSMTSSGRLTSTEKIGCTRLIAGVPRSVVVAVATAARDHHDGGDSGADGGGDQRRLDRLGRPPPAGHAGVASEPLLGDAGAFADGGEALAGQVLGAVAQVAHLLEGVVRERLGGGLGAGLAGDGHVFGPFRCVRLGASASTVGGAGSLALRGQAYVPSQAA